MNDIEKSLFIYLQNFTFVIEQALLNILLEDENGRLSGKLNK